MSEKTLQEKIDQIKIDHQPQLITPRELINGLGYERRTTGNIYNINAVLEENCLELSEDYTIGYIDRTIELRHKAVADHKVKGNPIKTISILNNAHHSPVCVTNDTPLIKAITLMLLYDYSQIPVTTNPKNCIGYISWETIGKRLTTSTIDIQNDLVKPYVDTNITIIPDNTPLLKAIKKIYRNGFAVITNATKDLCGLITTYDISSEFFSITEPFLLLEQIENHIRQLLGGKILLEHIRDICNSSSDRSREIRWIDDLTFGEYLEILNRSEHWEKLNIAIDKTSFTEQLDKVRKIRNRIMHFEPEGITEEDLDLLKSIANFFNDLQYD